MPQLLIVRHAIAEDRDEATQRGLSDAERALTPKGTKRMRAIAAALAPEILSPATLYTSPLIRAWQTAEILASRLPNSDTNIIEELSPGSPATDLIKRLNKSCNTSTCILVGHEPDLSTLISLLLFDRETAAIELKKGGAALLDFPQHIDRGKGTLLWLMTPRQLRMLNDSG